MSTGILEQILARLRRLREIADAYKAARGHSIKRQFRSPAQIAFDVALGRLHQAIGEPVMLPADDPISIRRLADYREAMLALRAESAARKESES